VFDQLMASIAAARSPGERVRAHARLENAACAARLAGMADMLAAAHAADGSADREQWRLDNWAAVCAHIGAAHDVTSGVASGLLLDAVTLRERLPRVATVYADGRIAYRLVHAICARTMLVQDEAALRTIDAKLSALIQTWGAMSVSASDQAIDTLVLRHDPYAVRSTQSAARGCHAEVYVDDATGVAHLSGSLLATDGKALDERLDALARTTCHRDPRTADQRRAAALGAMSFGWDRLPCLCEQSDCDAATKPGSGGVVIHVIARGGTVDTPASDGPRPTPEPPTTPESEPEPKLESEPDEVEPGAPSLGVGDAVAQRRSLVGEQQPLLPKPWYTYTWSGLTAALNADAGECPAAAPAAILGGPVVPGSVAAVAAMHSTIKPLIHPGQAPPEPRYRPSRALADFVRCRDLTCRFPGCTRSATGADLDHTIPYPYGPTCASNLKCLCREHHLLKTFWPGWRDEQLPDGTVIWTDPDGHTYTTHPGSRLLFPELGAPTAEVTVTGSPPVKHIAGLTMPKRLTTRAAARRQRIDDERRRNAPCAEQYLRESIPPF
jgi:hypothetical protein